MHHAGHGHSGLEHHASTERNLLLALAINLCFSIIEIVGGLWTNSVAILSDALHDFGDVLALALALGMQRLSRRQKDRTFSYGYRRFSLLAALINGVILLGGSIFILSQAIPRLLHPAPVHAEGMIVLAVLGVLFNGAAALRLRRGRSMNERMAGWHMMEDLLGWAAVLLAALVMHFVDFPLLDPLLAIAFNAFILIGVARLLWGVARIFLQGTPGQLQIEAIEAQIRSAPGVESIHGTHLWSLDGAYNVLTTHVVVAANASMDRVCKVKAHIRETLEEHSISHTTIEVERSGERCLLDGRDNAHP